MNDGHKLRGIASDSRTLFHQWQAIINCCGGVMFQLQVSSLDRARGLGQQRLSARVRISCQITNSYRIIIQVSKVPTPMIRAVLYLLVPHLASERGQSYVHSLNVFLNPSERSDWWRGLAYVEVTDLVQTGSPIWTKLAPLAL